MIESEKHLVNLGICERCKTKRYLTVRERKKGLLVYLILESSEGKRRYKQVTKIPNSALVDSCFGNVESSDGDSLENLALQLRSISTELLKHVTNSKNHNTDEI